MSTLHRAQSIHNSAVAVATRAMQLHDALDLPLDDLRHGRDITIDSTIAMLEGQQEFYLLVSGHQTLLATLLLEDAKRPPPAVVLPVGFFARLRWLFLG